MKVEKITKEEIQEKYIDFLTVGRLKAFLEKYNPPDSANVLIQRVEDVYYEKHGWKVLLKEGEHTFKDEEGNIVEESLDQYHPAWSCVKYRDEDDLLFIDMHY